MIEGYRSGKYGAATVGRLLGHESRWDTERWLADRGVPLNYAVEDLESDRRTLARLFPTRQWMLVVGDSSPFSSMPMRGDR